MKGWYFSNSDKRLRHGDGRLIEVGATHRHEGPIALCAIGLHFSVNPLDALHYASGPIVWRVEGQGSIIVGEDKVVCSERTYIAGGIDVTEEVQKYACNEALRVAHLWNAPAMVIQFLKTGDEELRQAASEMAVEATVEAARAADWVARVARVAAVEATVTAAMGTAMATTIATVEAARAARAAIWAMAVEAVEAAVGAIDWAARAADWAAARDEAMKEANARLTRVLNNAIKEAR